MSLIPDEDEGPFEKGGELHEVMMTEGVIRGKPGDRGPYAAALDPWTLSGLGYR
jgi:hypothetical protein